MCSWQVAAGLGDAHPSTVRFRTCLELIQLMHVPKTSSHDTVPNLIDFIRISRNDEQPKFGKNLVTFRALLGPEVNMKIKPFTTTVVGWPTN